MTKTVNQDFVATVIKKGSSLSYLEWPIEYDQLFIQRLKESIIDDAKTLMDVMDIVSYHRRYMDSKREYQYASTNIYNASYVSPAIMPNVVSASKYKSLVWDTMDYKIHDYKERRKKAERIIKERYVKSIIRYVYAEAYYNTIDTILDDIILGNNNILLYSTEKIGWDTNSFKVTDDIDIIVKTNFCYGEAAYMNFSFKYKGILITPYSDYISYFYARMYSIINCTRSYCPQRDNWKKMFNFIIELSDLATNNIDKFLNRWLVAEINSMIEGLKDMYYNTSKYIHQIYTLKSNDIDFSYIRISLISSISHRNLMVTDDELELSFLGEKLSGALRFIDNLKQAELLHVNEITSIDTIIHLNKNIKPRLKNGVKNVEKDIERIEPIEHKKRKILEDRQDELTLYVEKIRKLKSYIKIEHNVYKKHSDTELENLLSRYLDSDETYKEKEMKKESARKDWYDYKTQLDRRNNYRNELISYINNIESICGI